MHRVTLLPTYNNDDSRIYMQQDKSNTFNRICTPTHKDCLLWLMIIWLNRKVHFLAQHIMYSHKTNVQNVVKFRAVANIRSKQKLPTLIILKT